MACKTVMLIRARCFAVSSRRSAVSENATQLLVDGVFLLHSIAKITFDLLFENLSLVGGSQLIISNKIDRSGQDRSRVTNTYFAVFQRLCVLVETS